MPVSDTDEGPKQDDGLWSEKDEKEYGDENIEDKRLIAQVLAVCERIGRRKLVREWKFRGKGNGGNPIGFRREIIGERADEGDFGATSSGFRDETPVVVSTSTLSFNQKLTRGYPQHRGMSRLGRSDWCPHPRPPAEHRQLLGPLSCVGCARLSLCTEPGSETRNLRR